VATDLLAKIRGELDERMAQLRPLLSEYERLVAAADALAAVDTRDTAPEAPPAQAPPTPERAPRAPRVPRAPAAPAPLRERPPRGSAAGTFALAMSLRTTPVIQPAGLMPAARAYKPAPPRPTAQELIERAPAPPSAVERNGRAAPAPGDGDLAPTRKPAPPAAVQQAILAALEHGSHTASELVMVTAMSTPEIRGSLSRRGAIAKVKRRGDGKGAYALPAAAAHV
jgi:hypothetical protein